MDDEKITLDVKAFKTLASDSRIGILKSLDKRRKTLTELSKQFGLSASTVKEHMEKLTKAELVRMVDDGHKWKYYELTRKGRQILHPGTGKIWVMLVLALFGLSYAFWDVFRLFPRQQLYAATNTLSRGEDTLMKATEEVADGMTAAPGSGMEAIPEVAGEAGAQALPPVAEVIQTAPAQALPLYHILGIALFALVLGLTIAMLYYRRREMKL